MIADVEPTNVIYCGGTRVTRLWESAGLPAGLPLRADAGLTAGNAYRENFAGTSFYVTEIPGGERAPKIPMHSNLTLDYMAILSGRLRLKLPGRDFDLRQGDTLIQGGNEHSFEIRGPSPVCFCSSWSPGATRPPSRLINFKPMTTPFPRCCGLAAMLRAPMLATLSAAVSSGLFAGCATSESAAGVREVNRQLATFTAENLELATDAEMLRTRREGLDALLAAPLAQDAAVRVALLGSPSLQALLAGKSAAIAGAARAGRIDNPILNYERVRHGSELEIGRLLSFGLLELLTLPQRQRVATAAVEAAQTELAIAVIDEVTRVRQAWVRAVAAEQRQRYAARVLESAAASAELARRMESVGNFNKMARARQQAFAADARTQAVLARQQASVTREELVRALGLDDEYAKRLQLPERLPEIPQQALSADAVDARVNAERVDVKLAEAQWQAAAARRGLGKVTTLTDIELGLRRDPEARGYEIDVRLPIFDAGELDRRALDGETLAAAGNLEATLRAAGSHLRESYSAYLAAYDIARHHRDELVPLRKTIAEESLLRYNGMIIGVFELLADAREQITTVMAAIDAEQQFWLAEASLQSAFAGRPVAAVTLGVAAAKPAEAAGGH